MKYIMPAFIIATRVLISANYCAPRILMMIGMWLYEGVKVRSTLNINISSSRMFICHLMTPLEPGHNEAPTYLVFKSPALKAPRELGIALCHCSSLGS